MDAEENPQLLSRLLIRYHRDLVEQAQALGYIEDRLLQQLSADIRPHVRIARCDNESVVLMVDDAAWATKLRFMADEMLSSFAQLPDLPSPLGVEVRVGKVSFPNALGSPKPIAVEPLGRRSREALESVAATSDNPELVDVLRRIARRKP